MLHALPFTTFDEAAALGLGVWHDEQVSTCDARSETLGMTITAAGRLIGNDGGMICQIEKLEVGETRGPIRSRLLVIRGGVHCPAWAGAETYPLVWMDEVGSTGER
jgi:hypothetical protein